MTNRLRCAQQVYCALVLMGCFALSASARDWTDSTGHFKLTADLVATSDTLAVLKREDGTLVAMPLAKLSKEDLEYLKSKEAADAVRKTSDQVQTWTLTNGYKLVGRVVSYGRKNVSIQRRRGRFYVNDRLFSNLPELYQKIVPAIVSHFEKEPINDQAAFEAWVLRQRGQLRTFTYEGVVLEMENGDEYGVPFFLFSADDLKVLEPGWKDWFAADKERQLQADHEFLLQSLAQQYQEDRKLRLQIAMMQLDLQAYTAGLFSLWEVHLIPPLGHGRPFVVIEPGRNSDDAARSALLRNPGFTIGGIARVRRQN
ncbi:SHD1 domain-containing protein [Anatilimnocola sp. NA78]|uniref:SHD1 domain-containing protein n=1 Tax=Anatilimnocola sp. NA78 TaxID=3415683 RepID=UPI003CE4B1AF